MAIEDFEWEGDLQEARLPPPPSVSESANSAPRKPSWLARLRESVWLEPALRLSGMALLLGVLSGIGVVATTYAKPGVKLPEGSRLLTDALGSSWLKPTPPEPSAAPAHAHPHARIAAASSAAKTPEAAAPPPHMEPSAAAPPAEAPPVTEPAPGNATPPGITPEGKVILNLASAEELTKLPGVGLKRATAIVALRTKLKRFKHATDLLRVKGIGPRGLQRMLPHLVLDAPGAS
ncbi:MAG TPA: helix-hairpin-helix domain-containing protein [Polyangiaceae bacterium]|nr:helix-hairpin-helix domain-containing protein [Polyangiaceae bacterium]